MRSWLVLPLLIACGGDDGSGVAADASLADVAPPREQIRETRTLQPGEFAEGMLTGGPADLAIIHLEAPHMQMDWNLHAHPNNQTITIYEEYDRMIVDYVFTPSTQSDTWLLVRNSATANADVLIDVGLYGNMQWVWE